MSVSASELQIVYGSVTVGGSTARQITEWTRDEHDFVNGSFEFEFVTTAATDAAFSSELDTIRNEFRRPRRDLTVTQNGVETLHRKHSDNTGLDTFPQIVKDGDPADTGRSRHFRVRITYELPADQTATNFRRGSTITVSFSPARRRTVTISTVYTANSTDGTTPADTQYFNQIAAAETTLLNMVDSTQTWERVGQPQVEFFETRKVCRATRVYRELKTNQAVGVLDNLAIIDPHLEVTVEQMAIDDSLEAGITITGGGGGGGGSSGQTGVGNTTSTGPTGAGGQTGAAINVKRPVMIRAEYDASIDFGQTTGLQALWDNTIRPLIIGRIQAYNVGGSTLVLMDEQPAYEDYENHIRGSVTCLGYFSTIIRQEITYEEQLVTGEMIYPITSKNRLDYYNHPGPATLQMTITEEREEWTTAASSRAYEFQIKGDMKTLIGGKASGFDGWILVSCNPQGTVKSKGLIGAGGLSLFRIGYASVQTVLQFINKKPPSVQNAGGVTGATLT